MSQDQLYSGKTQVHWTCKALLDNRIISQRTELQEVSGWRLPAIIHRLKQDYGWPIEKKKTGPDNVAHYFLAEGTDRSKLRFPRSAKALANQEDAQ